MKHDKIESQIVTVKAPSSVLNSVLLGRISVLLDTLPHIQLSLVSEASADTEVSPAIEVHLGQTGKDAGNHIHCGVLSYSMYLPRNVERANGWVGCTGAGKPGSFSAKTDAKAQAMFRAPPRLRTSSLPTKIDAMKAYALAGMLPDAAGRLDADLVRLDAEDGDIYVDIWVTADGSDAPAEMIAATTEWIRACICEARWLNGPDPDIAG